MDIMEDFIKLYLIQYYISGLLTNLLFDKVIAYLPFFNFWGASEGIKSINIIVWRVLLYVALIVLLLVIINKILDRTGVLDRIDEKIITMRKWGRYLGCLFVIPFMMVFIYNVILVLGMPIFNISQVHEASISKFLVNNMILLKDTTGTLEECEAYAIDQINDNNTIETYTEINSSILSYLEENELIDSDSVTKLKDDDKLTGTKSKNIEKKDNNGSGSSESDDSGDMDGNVDDDDSDYYDDSDSYDNDEYYDDSEEFYDDEYYEGGPGDDEGEYYYDDDADVL